MNWVVHKFGGTSVADASRYKNVAKIVDAEPGARKAIVVSAMAKVTDALIEIADLARSQNSLYLQKLDDLKDRHERTAEELLPAARRADFLRALVQDVEDLKEILRGIWHVRSCSERTLELISGYGEVWSARLLHSCLSADGHSAQWLDARQVLVVDPGETAVHVAWSESKARLEVWLRDHPADLIIITGFVASTIDGIATTLRRNGSDYSASIFGALLQAESITIWTDVDGILSADPRLVPEAIVLDDLSYQEATELAYFGAKVVHPSTMAPAIRRSIPIWIRNTFNPSTKGTRIHAVSDSQAPIKGFATVDRVALINLEGTGMVGVPGIAQRLFGALRDIGVSVIMISQASSEHSICFAIPVAQSARAKEAVETTFMAEIQNGVIQTVDVNEACRILAAVGDNMVHQPGLAGRFLSALGRAGVSVRAIAQGSSERNISVVLDRADATRALRAVHAGFFLSNHTLSIGVIGLGGIGATLLRQLHQESAKLRDQLRIDLRVRGIANSKRMLLHEQALDLGRWSQDLEAEGQTLDLNAFTHHIRADHLPHAVVIDCTADGNIAREYANWLEAGIHVITPNKKANTDTLDSYRALKRATRARKHAHYLYETTVGAGLPILNTLRELVRTGDRITEIEGVFSGTLSFIFNSLAATNPFSEVVKDARKRGYTEPDPRDDLSGTDVARKLVILGREMGLSLELKNVEIEALLPPELLDGTVENFLSHLPKHDPKMLALVEDAAEQGAVLRYVGRIDEHGHASVVLRRYTSDHAFAHLRATDNIVAFRTSRYTDQPLIVQGPGAGPEVTAGGVFADILRLSSYLGAPL